MILAAADLAALKRDVRDGWRTSVARNQSPTTRENANMELVMQWMAWLRLREGDQAVRRIALWATGKRLFVITRCEHSERTVANRID
jgi:hypothetical protein